MYRKLKAPVFLQVEVTTGCNLRCRHCYNSWQKPQQMPFPLFQRIVDEAKRIEVPSILITGGEPLSWPDLPKAIELVTRNGLDVSVNSNSTLMTEALAKKLKAAGLSHYMTTIFSHDGATHDAIACEQGAHAATMAGMAAAAKAGLKIGCNMVVDASNHTHIAETYHHLKQLFAITAMSVTKASPPVNCEVAFEPLNSQTMETVLGQVKLLNQEGIEVGFLECYPICMFDPEVHADLLIGRSCAAGVTTCTIGPSGEVRPCSPLHEVCGNISDTPFDQLWDEEFQHWRDGSYKPEDCQKCKLFKACTGGCRAEAYCATGSLSGMDPWAKCSEERIDAGLATLKRIIEKKRDGITLKGDDLVVTRPFTARKEAVGWMVFNGGIHSGLVTEDAYALIQKIREAGGMTVNDLAKLAACERTAFDLFIKDAIARKLLHKTASLVGASQTP